jgi:hypothetical protein
MKSFIRVGDTILRYILWFAIFAAGLWLIQLLRGNLFDILVHLRVSPWGIPAVSNFFAVIAFIGWLATVIWLESYLTAPPDMVTFWRRLGHIAVPMLGITIISYILQALL